MTNPQLKISQTICYSILSLTSDHPLLVGIDGKDASGKTTFADNLAAILKNKTGREVIRISLDNFFQPRAIRSRQQNQARGCYEDTFNIEGIRKQLLEPLRSTNTYTTKIFDYKTDSPVEIDSNTASNDAIVIVDGVFLQRPEFREYWDYVVLLEVSDEIAIERGIVRDTERIGDVETARQKYINRYIASQKIYYDECQPQQKASVIIDNSDYTNPAIVKGLSA